MPQMMPMNWLFMYLYLLLSLLIVLIVINYLFVKKYVNMEKFIIVKSNEKYNWWW